MKEKKKKRMGDRNPFEHLLHTVTMECRKAYFLLLAGEILWLSLLVATPYLASRGHTLFSGLLYTFFSNFCHQRPERSLFFFGEQVPVCTRDVAIYVAAFISSIAYPWFKPLCTTKMPSKWYLVVFLLPTALDGGTQLLGLRESTNVLRFVTGFWAGLVVPFYFLPLVMRSSSISRPLPVDVEDREGAHTEGIHQVAQGISHDGDDTYEQLHHEEQQ